MNLALETNNLTIRDFQLEDLETIHRISVEGFGEYPLHERVRWLEWQILNYRELAKLYQPPYGDRAVVLTKTNTLIGAVGYVPCCMPFDLLPSFRSELNEPPSGLMTSEMGLYWVIDTAYRGNGYAGEAAQALIDYAFATLNLKRIVATTEYDNLNSQAVMRKLGMSIERNPNPEPFWFQVVGVLKNPKIQSQPLKEQSNHVS